MRPLPVLFALVLPGLAVAEGRGVTIVNGSSETLREIFIAPAGSGGSGGAGENRLRSSLPSGAQARIGYSTGCRADIRVVFDSGKAEDFADQDACSELRLTAGQGAASAAATAAAAQAPRDPKRAKTTSKPNAYVPVTVVVP